MASHAPGSGGLRSLTPRSVEQITKAAQDYDYNALIGIRYWLRTAATLLKEAQIYEREGDDEQAYFLLFRHAHLILAHLPAHPDVNDRTIKPLFAQAQREVNQNLKRLDDLRPKINDRYRRYNQLVKEREARKAAAGSAHPPQRPISPTTQHLRAHENQALAVEIAHRELSRRASSRKATSQGNDARDLSRRLQDVRAQVDSQHQADFAANDRNASRVSTTTNYNYPAVRSHRNEGIRLDDNGPSTSLRTAELAQFDPLPPALPLKSSSRNAPPVPPLPEQAQTRTIREQPKQDTTYTFACTARLEDGTPLRTIFLPPTLRTTFLRLAHKNTLANLETCAFLAGTLVSNALFVSKLIVPSQTATSDTCEMTNESQLFDLVDAEADLMILGWIHTHPKQTCFMSSRDLHTHAGYQMMLAESIAIVCAPSKGDTSHGGEWGIYRLTDPPGKKTILACQKPGLFHPHDVDNIYTDALRPGHVVEAPGLEFDVVDMREA